MNERFQSTTVRLRRGIQGGFALALGVVAGSCYSGSFDPDASNVYACVLDLECPSGQQCIAGTCISDEGPHVSVLGPEPLQEFGDVPHCTGSGDVCTTDADCAMDETCLDELAAFQITVQGSDLDLADGSSHQEGIGVLEVRIDGEVVESRVAEGDISTGFSVGPFDLTEIGPGAHRIRVAAHRLDGMPYPNPSSVADAVFFVDDGNPHIAIIEPVPGSSHSRDFAMPVTIAAINYEWKIKGGDDMSGQGHTHVYSNDEYPGCLDSVPPNDDDCNFLYLVSISGDGAGSDPRMISGEVPVDKLGALSPGSVPLQAGLQTNNHIPFPDDETVVFDQIELHILGD